MNDTYKKSLIYFKKKKKKKFLFFIKVLNHSIYPYFITLFLFNIELKKQKLNGINYAIDFKISKSGVLYAW